MYFVDFDSVGPMSRPIGMTIPLYNTNVEAAIEEARRLKENYGLDFGQVYALTEDKGHSHIEVLVVKGDEMTRTRFAADDLGIATHLIDIMEKGGILFPSKFIITTV